MTTAIRATRWLCLVSTAVTLMALSAHVVELPNKFALDGAVWLAIQQNLYRGWGAFVGPFEVTAVASSWLLVWLARAQIDVRCDIAFCKPAWHGTDRILRVQCAGQRSI